MNSTLGDGWEFRNSKNSAYGWEVSHVTNDKLGADIALPFFITEQEAQCVVAGWRSGYARAGDNIAAKICATVGALG
jgi:hypothetical protein